MEKHISYRADFLGWTLYRYFIAAPLRQFLGSIARSRAGARGSEIVPSEEGSAYL